MVWMARWTSPRPFGDDLALFAGDGLGQVVGPFVHEVGGALEDAVAAMRRQLGHHGGAAGRAGNGGLHVGGGAPGHGVKGILVEGIDDGHLGIAVNPLAADIHFHGESSLRVFQNQPERERRAIATSRWGDCTTGIELQPISYFRSGVPALPNLPLRAQRGNLAAVGAVVPSGEIATSLRSSQRQMGYA